MVRGGWRQAASIVRGGRWNCASTIRGGPSPDVPAGGTQTTTSDGVSTCVTGTGGPVSTLVPAMHSLSPVPRSPDHRDVRIPWPNFPVMSGDSHQEEGWGPRSTGVDTRHRRAVGNRQPSTVSRVVASRVSTRDVGPTPLPPSPAEPGQGQPPPEADQQEGMEATGRRRVGACAETGGTTTRPDPATLSRFSDRASLSSRAGSLNKPL